MPIRMKVVSNCVYTFNKHVNQLLEEGWTPRYESLGTHRGRFYMILIRERVPSLREDFERFKNIKKKE